MKVRFYCENCDVPLRADPGKRIKCPKCGRVQVVPMQPDEGGPRVPSREPEREVEVHPEPVEERHAAPPPLPQQSPLPARGEKQHAGAPAPLRKALGALKLDDLFGALDRALDWRKLLFFFVSAIVTSIGAVILIAASAVTAWKLPMPVSIVLGLITICYAAAVPPLIIGGVSKMAAVELLQGRKARIGELFGFLGRRFLTLVLVVWAFLLACGIVLLMEGSLARVVHYLGSSINTALALVLFCINVALLFALSNVVLMVVIVAVHEEGIIRTVKRFLTLCAKKPGQLILGQSLTWLLGGMICSFFLALCLCSTVLTMMISAPTPNVHAFSSLSGGHVEYDSNAVWEEMSRNIRAFVETGAVLLTLPLLLLVGYFFVYVVTAVTTLYVNLSEGSG